MSVLFFGKMRDDYYCEKAIDFLTANVPESTIVLAAPGESFPEDFHNWNGDYVISYLSPWIIPEYLLKRAKIACINFHPGTPEYPGTGCTNFAIYNEEPIYGVMCHHMAKKVDSGKIIAVKRFPMFSTDSVYSLTQRCYAHMLTLFYDIVSMIIKGETLPVSNETWTRKSFRLSELNELKRITPDMSAEEIRRRVRAVTFPGYPGAYVEIGGERFEYIPNSNSK